MKNQDSTEKDAKNPKHARIAATSEDCKSPAGVRELSDAELAAVVGGVGMTSGGLRGTAELKRVD
jgi:mersacidin/lichenicidin family type 2 lantibiotic